MPLVLLNSTSVKFTMMLDEKLCSNILITIFKLWLVSEIYQGQTSWEKSSLVSERVGCCMDWEPKSWLLKLWRNSVAQIFVNFVCLFVIEEVAIRMTYSGFRTSRNRTINQCPMPRRLMPGLCWSRKVHHFRGPPLGCLKQPGCSVY